jgi:phosphoglycerate dehydrogenase-like enzyme
LLLERLASSYEIIEPTAYDDDTLAESIKEADVAVGSLIAPKVLATAGRLRYLQTPGTGLEMLDLSALAERGVMVCKSTSHAPQVAEHAVAMLLALMRKVALHDRLLRAGMWYRPQDGPGDMLYQADSLMGATVGLVGYGAINQAVTKLLSGFGPKFLVHARHQYTGMCMVSPAEMMAQTDAVIIAVPFTDGTRGMIGAAELNAGYTGPYLVNVGRAEVVDRKALVNALTQRTIRGVALDVPYASADAAEAMAEFARFDNAIVSPHRAGTLRGTPSHLADVVDNLEAFAKGLPLKNIVNLSDGY